MKKFSFWILIGLCAVPAVSVRATEYIANGLCNVDPASGKNLLYSIDTNGELAFWCEELGQNYWQVEDPTTADGFFPMYMDDFLGVNEAEQPIPGVILNLVPWADYLEQIRTVNLTNVRTIGRYALGDIPNLQYVRIPTTVISIVGKAFMGSRNLQILEMDWESPLGLNEDGLWIDELESGAVQIPTIIVPYGCEAAYEAEEPWNRSTIITSRGDVGDTRWALISEDPISSGVIRDVVSVFIAGAAPCGYVKCYGCSGELLK